MSHPIPTRYSQPDHPVPFLFNMQSLVSSEFAQKTPSDLDTQLTATRLVNYLLTTVMSSHDESPCDIEPSRNSEE